LLASTPPPEPSPQPFFALLIFQIGAGICTFCLGLSSDPSTFTCQVAGITSMYMYHASSLIFEMGSHKLFGLGGLKRESSYLCLCLSVKVRTQGAVELADQPHVATLRGSVGQSFS
jgi:hypothetical protein